MSLSMPGPIYLNGELRIGQTTIGYTELWQGLLIVFHMVVFVADFGDD